MHTLRMNALNALWTNCCQTSKSLFYKHKLGFWVLVSLFSGFLSAQEASSGNNTALFDQMLKKYAPLISEGVELRGILQFPELQKAMPGFQKKLFERVLIRFQATRSSFDVKLEGDSEDLKELVRNQFESIRKDMEDSFRLMLENEPLYRMRRIESHKNEFEVSLGKSRKQETRLHFERMTDNKLLPERVVFVANKDAELHALTVADRGSLTTATFSAKKMMSLLYLTHVFLSREESGKERFYSMQILYDDSKSHPYPKEIILAETDEFGRALEKSGLLNPVSLQVEDAELEVAK